VSATELAPEDQARANFYALLARLFYAPPDRELLETLAAADEIAAEGGNQAFALAWRDLKREAAATDPEAAREEYESMFVGTGKAEVTLYTTAYATKGSASNPLHNPLVSIKDFLATRGLGRKHSVHEPEDHVAALCEVMRHLVTMNDVAAQRDFFMQYLQPTVASLCDAISGCDQIRFYRPVARFAARFFEVEHAAFDME
jgi:TorA maturation chaperone TorD